MKKLQKFPSERTSKDAVLDRRPNAKCVRVADSWQVIDGAEVLSVSGRGPAYAWSLADERTFK